VEGFGVDAKGKLCIGLEMSAKALGYGKVLWWGGTMEPEGKDKEGWVTKNIWMTNKAPWVSNKFM